MPLLAYNLTPAPLTLAAGSPAPVLPASTSLGARGAALNVTGELKGLSSASFALIQAQVAAGSCEFEWSGLPEYNTFPLTVGSAQLDVADFDVEIFADPILGDDANPGSQAQPVKTFQRAWTLGAVLGTKKRRIYLAAGTYPNSSGVPGKDTTFYVPPAVDSGEPLSVIGTSIDQLGVLTATVVDTHTTQVSAAPHVGSMVGATLRVLTGACAGSSCMIKADNGTMFTLCNSLEWLTGANMAPGDTFTIERPGSILTSDSNLGFVGSLLSLKNVKIDGTGGAPGVVGCVAVVFENMVNCEIANAFELAILNNAIFSPTAIGVLYFDPPPFDGFLESGGVYVHDSNILIAAGGVFGRASGFTAAAVIENGNLTEPAGGIERGGSISMVEGGFAIINTNMTVDGGGSRFEMTGNVFSRATWDGSPVDALTVIAGGSAEFLSADISNANGYAVKGDNATLDTGDLGGTGNTVGGLSLQSCTKCVAGNDGAGNSATTVTGGAGNDVLVGAVPKTYAAMAGTKGFGEVDGLNGPTLNRFSIRQ